MAIKKDPILMIENAREKGIPTFTIKATDKHAMTAITDYLVQVFKDQEVDDEFKISVSEIFTEWSRWQKAHPEQVKSPD